MATAFRALAAVRYCSVIWAEGKNFPLEALEDLGTFPSKYLSVSNPWARGEKTIEPIPRSSIVSNNPHSGVFSRMEYFGW